MGDKDDVRSDGTGREGQHQGNEPVCVLNGPAAEGIGPEQFGLGALKGSIDRTSISAFKPMAAATRSPAITAVRAQARDADHHLISVFELVNAPGADSGKVVDGLFDVLGFLGKSDHSGWVVTFESWGFAVPVKCDPAVAVDYRVPHGCGVGAFSISYPGHPGIDEFLGIDLFSSGKLLSAFRGQVQIVGVAVEALLTIFPKPSQLVQAWPDDLMIESFANPRIPTAGEAEMSVLVAVFIERNDSPFAYGLSGITVDPVYQAIVAPDADRPPSKSSFKSHQSS